MSAAVTTLHPEWTAGELAAFVREGNADSALEVLQCLVERGPGVVDFTDTDNRCACGEKTASYARHADDAGFEEHANDCDSCMPDTVKSSMSRFYRRGVP